jgi:hypothetical protein
MDAFLLSSRTLGILIFEGLPALADALLPDQQMADWTPVAALNDWQRRVGNGAVIGHCQSVYEGNNQEPRFTRRGHVVHGHVPAAARLHCHRHDELD